MIALAATMWGVAGTAAKHLFNQQVSPFKLVEIRLVLSFVFLFLYLAAVNRPLLRLSFADIPYFLVFGCFGVGMVQFTYLFTISQTNVATAVFLQYLAPVLAALYGMVFLRERPDILRILSLCLAVSGGFLIVSGNPGGGLAVSPAGLAGGIASAFAFAFYTVYGKKGLSRFNSWTLQVYGFGVGALAWSLYIPPWQAAAGHSAVNWLFFLYITVFATVIPFGLFFKGLNYLHPVKTGIISTLEPVVAAFAAWVILHETLFPLQILGAAMVCAGVILVQTVPAKACQGAGSRDPIITSS